MEDEGAVPLVGDSVGADVGYFLDVGKLVGLCDGDDVGVLVGDDVVAEVGSVGKFEGARVSLDEGTCGHKQLGLNVGEEVTDEDGAVALVGKYVGDSLEMIELGVMKDDGGHRQEGLGEGETVTDDDGSLYVGGLVLTNEFKEFPFELLG